MLDPPAPVDQAKTGADVSSLADPPPNVKLPDSETTEARPAPTPRPSDDLSILATLNRAAARPASKSPLWSRKAGEVNVVRSRQGSVLTRGLVLKTDHFEGTRVRPTKLDLSLQGAPNFRKADAPLEVYGTAQPTITGLRTILAVLGAAPPPAAAANKRPWQRTPSGMTLKSPPVSRQASHQLNKQAASPIESPDMRPITQQAKKKTTVWVCTREEPIIYIGARPFVLREQTSPINTFSLSSRADNLEAIEGRLKDDILREAARFGGLIMVHEEEGKGDEPKLKPTWIAVDTETVKTVRDVFEDLRSQGWACDYHRVPIAPDQPIENNYLDAYTRILQSLDPETSAVVANCGAGVTRTTFAMVAAQIVRRRQWILRGHPDPFNLADGTMSPSNPNASGAANSPSLAASAVTSPALEAQRRSTGIKGSADSSMAKSLRAVWEKQAQAQALLRLVQLLGTAGSSSPVELMLANPDLLEALRRALTGDFSVIRALCGILDAGIDDKVVVDVAIDSAAHLTNLREAVLLERASYALVSSGSSSDSAGHHHQHHGHDGGVRRSEKAAMHLDKAVRALEKYFFLLAFSSYVNTIDGTAATPQDSFASWLTRRSEIWNTIQRIRSKGKQLYLFDPVADLSQLRRGGGKGAHQAGGMAHLRMATEDSAGNSSEEQRAAAGDEFADHHVRNLRSGIVLRPGTLLKEDLWQAQRDRPSDAAVFDVRGAINFRRIAGTAIFATGQPTVDGIRNALKSIGDQLKGRARISCYWLNLREEPLIYVAGRPMVLRDSTLSLRNIKAYGGISWARLQLLEDRLKADVIHELQQNDGRLLLHSEDANGEIYPQWQEVSADDVETLQDVMGKVSTEVKRDGSAICGVDQLEFRRIPFTAEKPPDYEDLTALLQLVLRCRDSAIVNNCQLGRGRSTLASVIVLLIAQWLREHGNAGEELLLLANDDTKPSSPAEEHRPPPLSYHLINSLLRVIPHGLEVKRAVDEAIDQGSAVTNLRDLIEEFRLAAEEMDGGDDNPQRKAKIHAGCQALRRYFVLILFQSYLSQTKPDVIVGDMPTFQDFVHRQPVLQTISKEFENVSLALITPLQQNAQGSKGGIEAADGMALASEVDDVVAHRDGAILTAYTMLKSDFFSGIAKVHLSQIEGIPNLRQVPLLVGPPDAEPSTPGKLSMQGSSTWGSGMPTLDGLRAGLEKMKAGPKGDTTVVWTSLREEPVVYVRGRPHVLRLADQPLTNLEATGITTETVERQEIALKRDVIEEAARRDGRILLHDEVEVEPGKFDIIPVWESLRNPDTDVLTPAEAYAMVQAEGYRVDYGRVAVTDEQAPLPGVFKAIEGRVLTALRQGAATAFNCQMGRGRTTTGMVIAALVSTVHHHRDEILAAGPGGAADLTASGVLSGDDSVILDGGGGESTTGSVAGDRMTGAKDFLDNREEELLLNGEYRIILRLVGVLSQGKLAKLLVDEAVDRMDQVQNLRVACYDARLRAENAPVGSAKRRHLSTVFNNYLARYAYLIAFANHLLIDEEDGAGVDVHFQQVKELLKADEAKSRRRTTSTGTTNSTSSGSGVQGMTPANASKGGAAPSPSRRPSTAPTSGSAGPNGKGGPGK